MRRCIALSTGYAPLCGAWPENDVFKFGPFLLNEKGKEYYEVIDNYLKEKTEIKNYGRLKHD